MRGGYGLFYLGAHERGGTDGYSRATSLVASLDSNQTPAATLVNAFPGGLLRPIGNSQGRNTSLGQNIGTVFLDRPLPYSHQFSFGFQRELNELRNRAVVLDYQNLRHDPTIRRAECLSPIYYLLVSHKLHAKFV